MATANKTLQTRIQLKYDSYENWISNNPVLLKGEIAVATVSVPAEGQTNTTNFQNLPNVVLKVGDGSSHYNDLKFVSGLAADVYDWAKASVKPSYTANEIGGLQAFIEEHSDFDTDTQYQLVVIDAETYKYELQSKPLGSDTWSKVSDLDLSGIDTRLDSLEATVKSLTGDEGGIQGAINTAIQGLDSEKDQTAGADGLALHIKVEDGLVTEFSGSIAANTYDAHGAAKAVQGETTKTVADVASEVAAAKEVADQAAADLIKEVAAREAAIEALDYTGYIAGNADGAVVSFVGEISETNGVISATKRDLVFESAYNAESNKAATMQDVTNAVADLNGAMHFEGVVESDPTAEDFDSTEYVAGDVIIFGTIEYVYDGKKWIKLGDETLAGTLIEALDNTSTNESAGHTVSVISQVDGNVTATFQKISITADQVSDMNATVVKPITDRLDAVEDRADTLEENVEKLMGTGEGSVDKKIAAAIDALDTPEGGVSQAAAEANGYLALNIVEENGIITSLTGSVDASKFEKAGAAKAVQGETTSTVADAMAAAAAAQKAADDEAAARDSAIKALDGSATATATSDGTVNVLTSVVESDGVISKGAEVNLSKVAQSGKVQDLIQDADTYIVFDCGSSTKNIAPEDLV